ncbi:uncharacterized protein LOC133828229 [Humulus lupulus]|uniref:uncharacterized protein LOC133828229 n=1 Tax=Humulus lupulus TaxID=3486 RepID=UPI002B411148|nr:uncharacterized protein LOC133828229 [Humulus lupulus]
MPSYVKFMKEILSRKRKLEDYETVALTEERNAILPKKLPPKLKDPGSFNIPCSIADLIGTNALYDLGASVNLMPLSMFQKMNLGEARPTTVSLQMTDRLVNHPLGVIEDVFVKVGELKLQVQNDEVIFKVFAAIEIPTCCRVEVVNQEGNKLEVSKKSSIVKTEMIKGHNRLKKYFNERI